MNALVLQPHGLGDAIFCQTLVNSLEVEHIYWPVTNFKNDLKIAYPNIIWTDENFTDIDTEVHRWKISKNSIVVPIRWSDTIMKVPYKDVMKSKYDMYDLDWRRWKECASWRADFANQTLLNSIIQPPEKYNLVSNLYTGSFKYQATNPNPNLPNVYIKPLPGFSLFDWAQIITNATEIHFVASSNIYLLELLPLKAERICIYKRGSNGDHSHYDYLMTSRNYFFVNN